MSQTRKSNNFSRNIPFDSNKTFNKNMGKIVENQISRCIPCEAIYKPTPTAKLNIMPIPKRVLERINVNYIGPKGQYIFVAIDQQSRFPEIEFINYICRETATDVGSTI